MIVDKSKYIDLAINKKLRYNAIMTLPPRRCVSLLRRSRMREDLPVRRFGCAKVGKIWRRKDVEIDEGVVEEMVRMCVEQLYRFEELA